jgi:hypothetical protein
MQELKLEVGKKYIVPHDGYELYTFVAEILAFPKNKDRQFVFTDSKGKYVFYSISYIKGIKEHIEELMQEVKLEVGKKYNSEGSCLIYFGNINDFCNVKCQNSYKFVNQNGQICSLSERDIKNIKEHREPFKQIFEGWVWYDSDMPLYRTNKKYYETKEECLRYTNHFTKAIKIRVTEEEIFDEEV